MINQPLTAHTLASDMPFPGERLGAWCWGEGLSHGHLLAVAFWAPGPSLVQPFSCLTNGADG